MSVTTVSSREFQQNANRAQRAAEGGPVFITRRGRPAHVLLSYDEYRRITGDRRNVADLLAMPGAEDIEFDIPQSRELSRAADLS